MKFKIFTIATLLCFTLAVSPFSLAKQYEVEMVVQDGKKSKETDAVLVINDDDLEIVPKKDSFKDNTKKISFSEIKTADYSYSKKPMLSGGGAVATAILLGVFVVPFLFMKKKNHWLTVQTENDFAVLKLGTSNHRAIVAEFETHGVTVNELEEEKDKK
ncbi:MAG: hypothetical protein J5I65_09230 [Aridibacter famidurans]|nr:hypothetical protein [Aridibacter famidurans]